MNNTGGPVNVEERVGYKWWRWNWRPTETTLFLMIAWIGYFTGAASSGAALFIWSRSAAAAIPLALVLIVVSYTAMKQLRKNSHIDK
jgi:uncharacterized membrane protein YoaK (UPF0700 family)